MKLDTIIQGLFVNVWITGILLAYTEFAKVNNVVIPYTIDCPISDFVYSLPIAFLFVVSRYMFLRLMKSYNWVFISQRSLNDTQYDLKVDRFSHNLYQFLYHLFTTIYFYRGLQSQFFFPAELGGENSLKSLIMHFELLSEISLETQRFLQTYFIYTAGFHISQVFALFTTRFNYYVYPWEMAVRVSLLALLIVFGYVHKFLIPGAIILLIHDCCDVFSFSCKTFADTSYRKTTFTLGLLLMIIWMYGRIYCSAKIIIAPLIFRIESTGFTNNIDKTLLLCLLLYVFFMNIYWFALATKSCYLFISKGIIQDFHNPNLPKGKEHIKSQ